MVIEELVAILGYDIRGEENLKRFNAGMDRTAALANRAAVALVSMGTIAAGAMLALGKSVIETSAEFEGFQTSLETIDGSAQKAKESMGWISQFAKSTPYEVAGITEAFIKLRSYGVDPMNGTLRTLGDTASAMNKPLNQAVEAFADAATFQFERLKEFGITSSQKGDQVTFSWTKNGKQMTKVVKKNGDDIRKFVLQNFGERFGGAMERQSKTWNGMMSNLGDSWTDFKRRIGDAGFFDNVKRRLAGVLDYIAKLDKNGTLDRWAKGFSDALSIGVDEGVNLIERLVRHFKFLTKWATDNPELFSKIAAGVKTLGIAFAALKFPRLVGLLVLEDFLTWLEGHPSVIGDFAKQLSDLSGIDLSNVEKALGAVSIAGASFLLFGGSFKTIAGSIKLLGRALAFLGGPAVAGGLATLRSLAGTSAGTGIAAWFGKFLAKASPWMAMLALSNDDAHNKYATATQEEQKKMRARSRNYVDRENAAVEMGDRRRQMEDLLAKPAPGNIDDNTPGLAEKFGWLRANMSKVGGSGAVQNVVNDNSDRRVVTNTEVKLTVQQITEAASAAAEAVKGKVSAALSGVSVNTPARATPTPSF